MINGATAATDNHLLAALPYEVLSRLMPALHPVSLTLHQILQKADTMIDAVHFILNGRVSLVLGLGDGSQAEVGLLGWEGMVGLPLMAGENSLPEAMVQGNGAALRMDAAAFHQFFKDEVSFHDLLLRYADAMHVQVMQTAACNGHHDLEQRLARWLLMTLDRSDSNDLELTHDFLALMLCVHRPGVTTAAGTLQRAGVIHIRRGHIAVLNRPALEAAACDCYRSVKHRFDQLRRVTG